MYRTKNKTSEAIPAIDTGVGSEWIVTFTGRKSGAIGITYQMTGSVIAENYVKALYDAGYEMITILKAERHA